MPGYYCSNLCYTISTKSLFRTDAGRKRCNMRNSKDRAPGTILLTVINVAVFLWLSLGGATENAEYMLEHGAMYVPYILEKGEYYRLFTSMFLHFGFQHLLNNMIMLLVTGWNLELEMGTIPFLLTYLISGLAGNVLSGFLDLRMGELVVSAGASGAIFGIIGALLYVVIRNRGRVRNISGRGMVIMVLLSLYFGFASAGVDNAAHLGGLAAGFLCGLLLYRKQNRKYRRSA